MERNIRISDYDYPLPEGRIAKFPRERREQSKLLVCRDGRIAEDRFERIGRFLPEGSMLVFNNTKVIRYGRQQGADKGSFVYAKIEARSRKTDPFMALVASMVPESKIKERPKVRKVRTITL